MPVQEGAVGRLVRVFGDFGILSDQIAVTGAYAAVGIDDVAALAAADGDGAAAGGEIFEDQAFAAQLFELYSNLQAAGQQGMVLLRQQVAFRGGAVIAPHEVIGQGHVYAVFERTNPEPQIHGQSAFSGIHHDLLSPRADIRHVEFSELIPVKHPQRVH